MLRTSKLKKVHWWLLLAFINNCCWHSLVQVWHNAGRHSSLRFDFYRGMLTFCDSLSFIVDKKIDPSDIDIFCDTWIFILHSLRSVFSYSTHASVLLLHKTGTFGLFKDSTTALFVWFLGIEKHFTNRGRNLAALMYVKYRKLVINF